DLNRSEAASKVTESNPTVLAQEDRGNLNDIPWGLIENQNSNLKLSSINFLWPVLSGRLTSGYGLRGGSFHEGVDIAAPQSTPIRAAASGRVVFSGVIRGYGRTVVLYHGSGMSTAYAHNSLNVAKVGMFV